MTVDHKSLSWNDPSWVTDPYDIAALDRLASAMAPQSALGRYVAQRHPTRAPGGAVDRWRRLLGHLHLLPAPGKHSQAGHQSGLDVSGGDAPTAGRSRWTGDQLVGEFDPANSDTSPANGR